MRYHKRAYKALMIKGERFQNISQGMNATLQNVESLADLGFLFKTSHFSGANPYIKE